MTETSITLQTEREAGIFMLAFVLGRTAEMSTYRIDPEEPQTILADVEEDDIETHHLQVMQFHEQFPE